jgi:hypothetical protein
MVVCLGGKVSGLERLGINKCLIPIEAFHPGALGSIPANFRRDSPLTKQYYSRFSLSLFGFPLQICHTTCSPNLSIIASEGVRWHRHGDPHL